MRASSLRSLFSSLLLVALGAVAAEPPRATTNYDEALKLCGGHEPIGPPLRRDAQTNRYIRVYTKCWCEGLRKHFEFGESESNCPQAKSKSRQMDCVSCRMGSATEDGPHRLSFQVSQIESKIPGSLERVPDKSPQAPVIPGSLITPEQGHAPGSRGDDDLSSPVSPSQVQTHPSKGDSSQKKPPVVRPHARASSSSEGKSGLPSLFGQAMKMNPGSTDDIWVAVILDTSHSMLGAPSDVASAVGRLTRQVAEDFAGRSIHFKAIRCKIEKPTRGTIDSYLSGDEYVEEFAQARKWLSQSKRTDKKIVLFLGDGISNYEQLGNPFQKARFSVSSARDFPEQVWKDLGKTSWVDQVAQKWNQKLSTQEERKWAELKFNASIHKFESAWEGLVNSGDLVLYMRPEAEGEQVSSLEKWSDYQREFKTGLETSDENRSGRSYGRRLADVVSTVIDKNRTKHSHVFRLNFKSGAVVRAGADRVSRELLESGLKLKLKSTTENVSR